MKKLSAEGFANAKNFVATQGRPLDKSLYAYHFENGDAADVLQALAAYQNSDGGFGHALEADLRLPDSSALATSVALQTLRQIGASATEPLVVGAIEYLLANYDASAHIWAIIPPQADTAPRAPWWDYGKSAETFGYFKVNPSAELAGYLVDYTELVPAELLQNLIDALSTHLDELSAPLDANAFICLRRLAESPTLHTAVQNRIFAKLQATAPQVVDADPATWSGYNPRPLWLVPTPESPLAAALGQDLLNLNLDYEIAAQNDDGSWSPPWSWFGAYPETWPQAEAEWHSKLTLDTLLTLRNFGRLESH